MTKVVRFTPVLSVSYTKIFPPHDEFLYRCTHDIDLPIGHVIFWSMRAKSGTFPQFPWRIFILHAIRMLSKPPATAAAHTDSEREWVSWKYWALHAMFVCTMSLFPCCSVLLHHKHFPTEVQTNCSPIFQHNYVIPTQNSSGTGTGTVCPSIHTVDSNKMMSNAYASQPPYIYTRTHKISI